MKRCIFFQLCSALFVSSVFCTPATEGIFTQIYENGGWGRDQEGRGTSGEGSLIENAGEYVAFINKFISRHGIKTIVDIGCGDWQVMRHVNLTGVEYYGMDVVKRVIDQNREKFGSSHIHFLFGDCIHDELPHADLLLAKDIFIHLPNESVFRVIEKFRNFKHILITTDVEAGSFTTHNSDIQLGEWRAMDPAAPPFRLEGKKALIYSAEPSYNWMKQVFYIRMP